MSRSAMRARVVTALTGIGCVVTISAAGMIHAPAASAAGPKPLCVFQPGSGMASDDISRIKCQTPDKTFDYAYWMASSNTLMSMSRGTLGYLDASMPDGPTPETSQFTDIWRFDASNVGFADFKKELMRAWGYTYVVLDGYVPATGEGMVRADYREPSKAKH